MGFVRPIRKRNKGKVGYRSSGDFPRRFLWMRWGTPGLGTCVQEGNRSGKKVNKRTSEAESKLQGVNSHVLKDCTVGQLGFR